jgi:hypothetical protein
LERWALLAPDFCPFFSLLRDVGCTRTQTRLYYSSLNLFPVGVRPFSPSMTLVLFFSLSLVTFSSLSIFSNVARHLDSSQRPGALTLSAKEIFTVGWPFAESRSPHALGEGALRRGPKLRRERDPRLSAKSACAESRFFASRRSGGLTVKP